MEARHGPGATVFRHLAPSEGNRISLPDRFDDHSHQITCRVAEMLEGLPVGLGSRSSGPGRHRHPRWPTRAGTGDHAVFASSDSATTTCPAGMPSESARTRAS